ncbi:MAG: G5 domain-containing protein [Clostridia bacterium]|nr:G5 domain-containing protein [Clostridia bacterium]
MKCVLKKLTAFGATASRYCGKRISALTLVVTVLFASVLSLPAVAEEEASAPAAITATVEMHPIRFIENNLKALESATVPVPAFTDTDTVLYSVTVKADGETATVCIAAGKTVADAIQAAGLALGDADKLNVSADRFVSNELAVEITRVSYKEYQKTFSLSYKTQVKYTSALRQGATKVERAGVTGSKVVTYRQYLEDGKVVSTETVKTEVTKQPVDKVVLKGTKVGKVVSEAPFDIALDSAGQPLNYKKKLSGTATAYTSDRGDSGAWTATGRRAQVGVVAVDPRVIPYGTKLWIVSEDGKIVYGYAIAGDTGGAVRSGKVLVDLYYDTYGECSSFGRRKMNVYVIG